MDTIYIYIENNTLSKSILRTGIFTDDLREKYGNKKLFCLSLLTRDRSPKNGQGLRENLEPLIRLEKLTFNEKRKG